MQGFLQSKIVSDIVCMAIHDSLGKNRMITVQIWKVNILNVSRRSQISKTLIVYIKVEKVVTKQQDGQLLLLTCCVIAKSDHIL